MSFGGKAAIHNLRQSGKTTYLFHGIPESEIRCRRRWEIIWEGDLPLRGIAMSEIFVAIGGTLKQLFGEYWKSLFKRK